MEKIDAKTIKIVITGPESSGKTTLCTALADHYKTSFVPEYARNYLADTDGRYAKKDLNEIAKGQIRLEDEAVSNQPQLLICDTSLEVIRVWSEWKYGKCDDYILEHARKRTPDLFLLLKPDMPWHEDPQRENPDDRMELFEKYRETLVDYNCIIIEIKGSHDKRILDAITAIDRIRLV